MPTAPQPPYHDPNNHVPSASDNDGWDDAWLPNPAAAILPPRRLIPSANPIPVPAANRPVVNYLGGRVSAAPDDETQKSRNNIEVHKLDVTEIAARLRVEEYGISSPPPRAVPTTFEPRSRKIAGTSPHGENHWWGLADNPHAASRWLWVSGAGVLLLVAITVVAAWPRFERLQQAPLSAIYESIKVIDDRPTGEVFKIQRILNEQSAALRIIGDYLAASSVDDVLGLIRDSERLAPTLHAAWRPATIPEGWRPARSENWSGEYVNDRVIASLVVSLPDQQTFTAYYIQNDDGGLHLDWEATTGHGTATVAGLAEGIGDGSRIRALITTATFHTAAFPEEEWRSFRLLDPQRRHTIWAYARRGGAAEASIMETLPVGEILDDRSEFPVTVALDPPGPDARPGQWILREKLHNGWVSP